MTFKILTEALDAEFQAACRVSAAEVFLDDFRYDFPGGLPERLVRADITENRKFPSRRHNEKENAVALRCARQTVPAERALCRSAYVAPKVGCDRHVNGSIC